MLVNRMPLPCAIAITVLVILLGEFEQMVHRLKGLLFFVNPKSCILFAKVISGLFSVSAESTPHAQPFQDEI
jgi:hypothetical protein